MTYVFPFREIFDNVVVKFILGMLASLFATDPELILMVVIAAFIDTILGSMAAYNTQEFKIKRVINGLINKLIRYGVVIALFLMPANKYEVLAFLGTLVYGVLWSNEAVSAVQHIKDPALKRTAMGLLKRVTSVIGVDAGDDTTHKTD